MFEHWLWILAGLVTLIVGAELLVRGSVWIALTLGMSKMMVGLTLVAFGTSAPELVVGLQSALSGSPGMATGTVLGSNIANIGLIVGASALIQPITTAPRSVRFELWFTLSAAVLVLLPLVLSDGTISRVWGSIYLAFIFAFTWILIRRHRKSARTVETDEPDPERGPFALIRHVVFIAIGLAGLKFGGEWLVDGASGVASEFGMTPELIGMTIVAVGTSLPELATAIVAARKGHPDLALGNVLGSNIFNVGMVLGATAVVCPLPMTWGTEGTAGFVGLGMVAFLVLAMKSGIGVTRREASVLLVAYFGYLTAAVLLR